MRVLLLAASFAMLLSADVVDRIAVVVGTNVITESELIREVRLTEFLNGEPLDLSPEKRKAAAERLVDQQLIRTEMEFSRYPQPGTAEADKLFAEFRKEHGSDDSQFRENLAKYGISEDELKRHLLWQATAMQFTENRFRSIGPPAAVGQPSSVAPPPGVAQPTNVQTANRARTDSDSTTQPDSAPESAAGAASTVDQQMDAWLKDARSNTRIQFKKEAFQ